MAVHRASGDVRNGARSPAPAGASFVGRQSELARLAANLAEARAGRGRVVLLAGEPGVGKTTLCEQFAAIARRDGVHVVWARCSADQGAPAYWPWIQILRALTRHPPLDAVRASALRIASEIAGFVGVGDPRDRDAEPRSPRAGGRLPTRPIEADLGRDPAWERHALFESIAGLLKRAAETEPLVLVVDDLHLAEESSLLLLSYVEREIRESRLLAVANFRDAETEPQRPLARVLPDLIRAPHAEHVVLNGLRPPEVAEFVAATAGLAVDESVVSALHDETDGNPFFLREIVALLASEGRLDVLGGDSLRGSFRVPPSVRDVIASRLDGVSPEGIRTLTIAAAIGHEFRIDVLRAVAGSSPESLHDVLEEAAAARLVTLPEPGARSCSFAHSLVRETLYQQMSRTRCMELHQQIAQAIEGSPEVDAQIAELAHHFYLALPRGDEGKALAYLWQAGRQASAQVAYEEAARLLEMAHAIAEQGAPLDVEKACALACDLGDARRRCGQIEGARQAFRGAAEIAMRLKLADLAARAALGFSAAWPSVATPDHELVHLLERALVLSDGTEPARRARLLARLGAELEIAGIVDRGRALSEQGLQLARDVGDASTLAYVLSAIHAARHGPAAIESRLAVTDEIIAVAQSVGDREMEGEGWGWRVPVLLELGDVAAADRAIAAHARLAFETGQPHYRWLAAMFGAMRTLLDGDASLAEKRINEALAAGQRAEENDAMAAFGAQTFVLHLQQGRLADLASVVGAFADSYPAVPAWRAAVAIVQCEAGRTDVARREFARLSASGFAALPRDTAWMVTMALLSLTCHSLGDAERAEPLYEELATVAGRVLVVGAGAACLGAADHYLGLVAATMGRLDVADRHLERAVEIDTALGARALAALAARDRARLRLADGAPAPAATAPEDRGRSISRTPPAATSEGPENVLRREGDFWTIEFEGTRIRVRDAVGVRYLAALVLHPGEPRHVRELAALVASPYPAGGRDRAAALEPVGMRASGDAGSAGAVVDARAALAYRRRLAELREELRAATEGNDGGRAERLAAEIDFVEHELAGAVGIGGRLREASSTSERLRSSVTKRIRETVRRLQAMHPALGRHLERSIKTGFVCAYAPSDGRASWTS